MIDVGELTTFLVNSLGTLFESEGVLVGDGVAPIGGGWGEGTPNTAAGFTPYVVVKGGVTTSMGQDTPLCTTVPIRFFVPYVVTSYENTRPSADELSARSRDHMKKIPGVLYDLGDLQFNPNHLFLDSVTLATRDDSVHPKMWSASTNLRANVARK